LGTSYELLITARLTPQYWSTQTRRLGRPGVPGPGQHRNWPSRQKHNRR